MILMMNQRNPTIIPSQSQSLSPTWYFKHSPSSGPLLASLLAPRSTQQPSPYGALDVPERRAGEDFFPTKAVDNQPFNGDII